ncbi:hypothetical protein V5N34_27510 [Streptomyces baarnensis]|uniref:hypothetical protein n=1 Tax=Streptomyces TaxID=1883 RepID=UPI0029BF31D9|nr:hypothetical protein [Streptomyces sp. ME02-6979.5a]MDX3342562.1 hypothetical protein [Streptomyces sp. ME02-6979.5a]
MSNVFEVSVSWTALFLMLAFAAVVGPPAVSSVTSWWSIRLRRWIRGLRDARAQFVAWLRRMAIKFLFGGQGT